MRGRLSDISVIGMVVLWLAVSNVVGVAVAQSCQLEIVLVLDASAAMNKSVLGWNATKGQIQAQAARTFVERSANEWQVGVVEYHDQASIRSPVTPMTSASVRQQVASSISGSAQGGSNLAEGIRMARTMLSEKEYGQPVMIVLGDWNPKVGDNPVQATLDESAAAKNEGIYLLTAGVAVTSTGEALMNQTASDRLKSFNALEATALQTWFESLKDRLCGLVVSGPAGQTETAAAGAQPQGQFEFQWPRLPVVGGILPWLALAAVAITGSVVLYRRRSRGRISGAERGPRYTLLSSVPEPSATEELAPVGGEEDAIRTLAATLEQEPVRRIVERVILGRGEWTTCALCRADVPLSRYCDHCGASLAPVTWCSECGRQVAATDRFCDLCGSGIA